MPKLSILDLVRVTQDTSPKAAMDNARDVAAHAENWGYERIWIAEHHNMPGIASAATSLVISHIAAGTSRIRVGSGGIMLPNHAPYIVAEQFGTLAQLYPNRIDLGLGRAPGTDGLTVRAMRRSHENAENFPQDVMELQSYFEETPESARLIAVPAAGTHVPLYILGSSHYGAMLAAELGLPYAFASHFAPDALLSALDIYRERFKPSATLKTPYAIAAINIIAADTQKRAKTLATTQQMSFAGILRGARGLSQPPIENIDTYWNEVERSQAQRMLAETVIGTKEDVKLGLQEFFKRTQADEAIVVSDIYYHDERLRSFEIISEAMAEL